MIDASALIRDARERAGFTQSELASRAGTSQPAVARYEGGTVSPSVITLERLLRACGVVLNVEVESGPSADLRGPKARLLRSRRYEVIEILKRHGFRSPRIFGSAARSEDTDASDIDLLVEIPESGFELMALLRATSELAEALDTRVDLATEGILRPEVLDEIRREAVVL